jgi:hypothetical protein
MLLLSVLLFLIHAAPTNAFGYSQLPNTLCVDFLGLSQGGFFDTRTPVALGVTFFIESRYYDSAEYPFRMWLEGEISRVNRIFSGASISLADAKYESYPMTGAKTSFKGEEFDNYMTGKALSDHKVKSAIKAGRVVSCFYS